MVRRRSTPTSNARAAALLRDRAASQRSPQKRWAYARAADAVLALDAPLESYVGADGRLHKIPNVGPSSERVILEALRSGDAHSAVRAMAMPGPRPRGTKAPDPHQHFLSSAEVAAVLENPTLDGPSLEDYRGDLQMHTTWSDGTVSVAEMADACRERSYTFCAITDHAHGLSVAGGISMRELADQQREIDAINRRLRGRFLVIKGIEANILVDGRLDLTDDELAQVELVVAAPHSSLRSDADQTERMLRVVSTQGVHILGHPRGRKAGARPGLRANWTRIFAQAAKTGVAIEIDGDPRRQDIDFSLAQDALAAGCFFALDSDAHAPDELAFAHVAIAHARLAGIPPSRVVNCWPLEWLLKWMRLRSTTTGP